MRVVILLLFASILVYAQDSPLKKIDDLQIKLMKKVTPSIAGIKIDSKAQTRTEPDFFWPSHENIQFKRPQDMTYTGTIIDKDGYIVTTYSNIAGSEGAIKVYLNKKEFQAEIVGYDANNDLALLKIDPAKHGVNAHDLPTLERSTVKPLKVGTIVYAVGISPNSDSITINQGIISSLDRLQGNGLQTDAKLNYGNVGGPLCDTEGRLIGISCKINESNSRYFGLSSGVGFAITADKLDEMLQELKKGTKIEFKRVAFLGIHPDLNYQEGGAKVAEVIPNTAAQKAGIRRGDIILEVDGVKINLPLELVDEIHRHKPQDEVEIKIKRNILEFRLKVKLGEKIGDW